MGQGASSKPVAASRISPQDRAILALKVQRDKLRQYEKRLVTGMEHDLAQSRAQLAAGHKDRARLHLAKRQHQGTLLRRVTGQLLTLEQLTTTLEQAVVEAHLLASLEAGNAVLRDLQREADLDRVMRVMEEVGDGIAAQREVEEALGGLLSAEESEAIAQELDQLVAAEQQVQRAPEEASEAWPAVPEGEPVPLPGVQMPTTAPRPAKEPAGRAVALPS